mgnify:CR=1 FL=1
MKNILIIIFTLGASLVFAENHQLDLKLRVYETNRMQTKLFHSTTIKVIFGDKPPYQDSPCEVQVFEKGNLNCRIVKSYQSDGYHGRNYTHIKEQWKVSVNRAELMLLLGIKDDQDSKSNPKDLVLINSYYGYKQQLYNGYLESLEVSKMVESKIYKQYPLEFYTLRFKQYQKSRRNLKSYIRKIVNSNNN